MAVADRIVSCRSKSTAVNWTDVSTADMMEKTAEPADALSSSAPLLSSLCLEMHGWEKAQMARPRLHNSPLWA
jgi:hypothetical protein